MVVAALGILSLLADEASAQYWSNCGGNRTKTNPPKSSGTEFLVCFMQNEQPEYDVGNPTSYRDIYLGTLDDSADITITCRAYSNFKKVIHLGKRQAMAYHIEQDIFNEVIIQSNEVVDDLVIRVVSTQPIVCYGMNHKQFTADASHERRHQATQQAGQQIATDQPIQPPPSDESRP